MSFSVIKTVMGKRFSGPSHKALMLALADTADDAGGGIFRSTATLAKIACISARHAKAIMADWRTEGLIRKVGEHKCSTGHTVVYALNLSQIESLPAAAPPPRKRSGDESSPVMIVHPTGDDSSPLPVTTVHPTLSLEPILDPALSQSGRKSLREFPASIAIDPSTAILDDLVRIGSETGLTAEQTREAWAKFCAHYDGQTRAHSELQKAWRIWCRREARHPSVKFAGTKLDPKMKITARMRAGAVAAGIDADDVDRVFWEWQLDAMQATGAKAVSENWSARFVRDCVRKVERKAESDQRFAEHYG